MLSKCTINRELLKAVVARLSEIDALSKGQREAINDDNADQVQELHGRIQAAFRAKERAVEAWVRHHREHGC